MDTMIVDLIEREGDSWCDDAIVWSPFTPDAREAHGDDYFIRSHGVVFIGCLPIGTLGDVKKSIEQMNDIKEGKEPMKIYPRRVQIQPDPDELEAETA